MTADDVEVIDPGSPGTAVVLAQSERMEMQNVIAWGRLMDASGFFPDTQSAAQAAVKILAGRELGFSTIASMTGIFVLDGKPVLGAGLMAQAMKRSGKYDYRVREHTDEICSIEVFQMVDGKMESIGTSTFTREDALQAGLGQRGRNPNSPSVWERYPRNMLFARAMSNAIAFYAPDVFEARVYTPEEIRPDLDYNEQGEPIDMDVMRATPKPMEGDAPAAQRAAPPQRAQEPRQRPRQPAADAGAGGFAKPGDVAARAHSEFGMQPSQVTAVLGSPLRDWSSRLDEAWARIVAAHSGQSPTRADDDDPAALRSPQAWPWYEDFTAALQEHGITAEHVPAALGVVIPDEAPIEAVYEAVNRIMGAARISAAEVVEQAAQIPAEEPEAGDAE